MVDEKKPQPKTIQQSKKKKKGKVKNITNKKIDDELLLNELKDDDR